MFRETKHWINLIGCHGSIGFQVFHFLLRLTVERIVMPEMRREPHATVVEGMTYNRKSRMYIYTAEDVDNTRCSSAREKTGRR
jgi:hypothetical protein